MKRVGWKQIEVCSCWFFLEVVHGAHAPLILSLNPIHDLEPWPFFFSHLDHEHDLSLPVFYGSELVWLVRLPASCGRLLRLLEHPSGKELSVRKIKMRGWIITNRLCFIFSFCSRIRVILS